MDLDLAYKAATRRKAEADYSELSREQLEARLRLAEAGEDTAAAADTPSDVPEGWFKKSEVSEFYKTPPSMWDPEKKKQIDYAMKTGQLIDDLDDSEPAPRTAADFSEFSEGLVGQKPEQGKQYFYRESVMKRITNNLEQFELHEPFLTDAVKHNRILEDIGDQ